MEPAVHRPQGYSTNPLKRLVVYIYFWGGGEGDEDLVKQPIFIVHYHFPQAVLIAHCLSPLLATRD